MIRKIHIAVVSILAGFSFFAGQALASDFDLAETAGTMRIWRTAEGLPSDSVTAVTQTRDGFLWAGTSAGLVRFDGVKFTTLALTDGVTNTPVSITALTEDSAGRLWIGTQQGGLYQLSGGVIRHFTTDQGLLDNSVTSLGADKKGMVWIGTRSGLNLWSGQKFESFGTNDGLPDKFVSGVNVARSGTVWIATRVGMCRFINGHIAPYALQTESQGRSPEYLGAYEDRRGNLWAFGDTYLINLAEGERFNYFRSSEPASVRIWSLCESRDGRLWIGTSGRGLFCFEDNHFQPVVFGESRWSYDVRAIFEDREGNLWLGTYGGGLAQLRPQSMHVLKVEDGLPEGEPTALAQDAGGKIYVGVQRAGVFARDTGRFERVNGISGLASQNFITSIGTGHDGTIWAGTLGNGLYGLNNDREVHFTTADGLGDGNVTSLCVDKQGTVWAANASGTVGSYVDGRFKTIEGPPEGVTTMIPSRDGGLRMGTQDGRVLTEREGKFTDLSAVSDAGHSPVLALHEGQGGELWIGYAGGGLAYITNGMTARWNTSNGLPTGVISGVVEDASKNLWLATDMGIYRVSRGDVVATLENSRVPMFCKFVTGAKTVPVAPAVFGGPQALLAPDGGLWFATSDGVLNVDARQSENPPATFPVYIENVSWNHEAPFSLLNGPLWSGTNQMTLPAQTPVDLKSLEIHFTALSYLTPGDIRFRHKLEGSDADWVNDAGARFFSYGHLSHGHYRFRVEARNADGDWQEAAQSFAFVVPTPFYLQGWAIFLYALAAVMLIAGIVRIVSHRRLRVALAKLEQQQIIERERMRIARDMHDEMGSKLTKISFLSEHAQVDAKASGALAGKMEDIAQTSRELLQTMDEIVWVVNPRNDTLENLVTYLSHYAIEYFQNTQVQCDLRLPQEIPHRPLSSDVRHNLFLTFEEALNNVLKHSGASCVQVEMTIKRSDFEVKITDNGHGFTVPAPASIVPATAGKRGGNGLKNMRQRLEDIGGECLITSKPDAGTVVTLRFRLVE